MSIITAAIPQQNFELVRDRIAMILTDELDNQFVLTGENSLNVDKVWNSRFVPMDKTEGPCVNVDFYRDDFGLVDQEESLGTAKYFIDCYGTSKSNSSDRGDTKSMSRVQRLAGVCRAILMDSRYKTLGFQAPSLSGRWIESIEVSNPVGPDATSMVIARLILVVKVNEYVKLLDSDMIKGYDTRIKIELTDEGYFYRTNNY